MRQESWTCEASVDTETEAHTGKPLAVMCRKPARLFPFPALGFEVALCPDHESVLDRYYKGGR